MCVCGSVLIRLDVGTFSVCVCVQFVCVVYECGLCQLELHNEVHALWLFSQMA